VIFDSSEQDGRGHKEQYLYISKTIRNQNNIWKYMSILYDKQTDRNTYDNSNMGVQ